MPFGKLKIDHSTFREDYSKRMSLWLTASIAIVIVGGAISAALLSMNLVIGLLSVYASAGIAAFIAWRNIVWRNREERFFSVGAVALLMTIVNRVIYAADVLLAGPRLDAWPLPDNQPEWFIFAGEAVTILGTLLTVAVWLRVTRFLNSDSSSQTANENTLEGIG